MTPTDRVNIGRLFWIISQFQAATYTQVTTTVRYDLRRIDCVVFDPSSDTKIKKSFLNPVQAAEWFQEAL